LRTEPIAHTDAAIALSLARLSHATWSAVWPAAVQVGLVLVDLPIAAMRLRAEIARGAAIAPHTDTRFAVLCDITVLVEGARRARPAAIDVRFASVELGIEAADARGATAIAIDVYFVAVAQPVATAWYLALSGSTHLAPAIGRRFAGGPIVARGAVAATVSIGFGPVSDCIITTRRSTCCGATDQTVAVAVSVAVGVRGASGALWATAVDVGLGAAAHAVVASAAVRVANSVVSLLAPARRRTSEHDGRCDPTPTTPHVVFPSSVIPSRQARGRLPRGEIIHGGFCLDVHVSLSRAIAIQTGAHTLLDVAPYVCQSCHAIG